MAATQAQLDEAEAAYHQLMLGKSLVRFRDSNGEEAFYNLASAPRLAQYIKQLRIELGLECPTGPMRLLFG
jgi:hypothetical protein